MRLAATPDTLVAGSAGRRAVVEHDTGRLLRFGGGSVVTQSLRKPYALTQTADSTIYIVESGDDRRPSGGIARVSGEGAFERLRLVPR